MNQNIKVKCIHCKTYEPNNKEIEMMAFNLLGYGFTCPRCNDECHVFASDKKVISSSELRKITGLY